MNQQRSNRYSLMTRALSLPISALLLLIILTFIMGGCAALLKGGKSTVSVNGPSSTVIDNYSGKEVSAGRVNDSTFQLQFPSGENYVVEAIVGEMRDTILLKSEAKVGYLIADLFFFPILSHVVDAVGDFYYDFDVKAIAFQPIRDSSTLPHINIYRGTPGLPTRVVIEQDRTYREWNAALGFGVQFPVGTKTTPPQGPNSIGITIGYRPDALLGINYSATYSAGIDLTAPLNGAYSTEGTMSGHDLSARIYPTNGLYGLLGSGLARYSGDQIEQRVGSQYEPVPQSPYSNWLMNWKIGAGLSLQGFFFEVGYQQTIVPLHFTDQITARPFTLYFTFGPQVLL